MTSPDLDVRIRAARPEDRAFILELVPRLMAFGPPPWREAAQMSATDAEVISNALNDPDPGTAIFIAETLDGTPLGFVHMNSPVDYFTREEYGHVSDVVVVPQAEGRGVGRALMAAGEEWARTRGYRLLVLNAFVKNTRARAIYEKLGFVEEMIKYVKEL